MSRGLGAAERFVIVHLAVVDRRPALMVRMAADWAHERRAARFPARGLSEVCDCPGQCTVVSASESEVLRRAVSQLEAKGIAVGWLDHLGRKRVALAEWPVTWRPGGDGSEDEAAPGLCVQCGMRSAGASLRKGAA